MSNGFQIPDVIRNAHGERIDFAFHPGAPGARRCVLLGHGVTGNKDRPLLLAAAKALSAAGIPVLRFSFAGNGESEGRFEEATIRKEVADLGALLDALPGVEVGYVGHSMGAAVGALRAAVDDRIRFLVSLGGMARTADFAQREFGALTPGKDLMWDNPACPLSQAYMDDLGSIGTVFDAASRVKVPWLLVHGLEDDVVPPSDSRELLGQIRSPRKLVELEGADHVFSGDQADRMASVVTEWVLGL